MSNLNALTLRDNAKYQLEQIKDIESGVDYLNKVKTIETWAKAEKKDAELQNMIAEQKIRTQRILGNLIRVGQERGEIKTQATAKSSTIRELDDFGINKKQSHTFQKIADIPENEFEEFIAEKKDAVNNAVSELTTAGIINFAKNGAHVSNNSGDNEWYTPKEYIDSALAVMGEINTDPASTQIANEIIKADNFYTAKENGLNKNWIGKVWMNPPYAQPLISQFCSKLITEIENKNCIEAIVLVNNATETNWFFTLAQKASVICFTKGRIKFWAPDKISAPLQGQAIIYFGENKKLFAEEFVKYGFICKF